MSVNTTPSRCLRYGPADAPVSIFIVVVYCCARTGSLSMVEQKLSQSIFKCFASKTGVHQRLYRTSFHALTRPSIYTSIYEYEHIYEYEQPTYPRTYPTRGSRPSPVPVHGCERVAPLKIYRQPIWSIKGAIIDTHPPVCPRSCVHVTVGGAHSSSNAAAAAAAAAAATQQQKHQQHQQYMPNVNPQSKVVTNSLFFIITFNFQLNS